MNRVTTAAAAASVEVLANIAATSPVILILLTWMKEYEHGQAMVSEQLKQLRNYDHFHRFLCIDDRERTNFAKSYWRTSVSNLKLLPPPPPPPLLLHIQLLLKHWRVALYC